MYRCMSIAVRLPITFLLHSGGAPQPPDSGDSKNSLKLVRFSSDSHLYSSLGVKKKLLKKSHSLLVVSGKEKRLQPVGSPTCVLDVGKEDRSSPLTQSLFVGRQPTIHFPFGDEECTYACRMVCVCVLTYAHVCMIMYRKYVCMCIHACVCKLICSCVYLHKHNMCLHTYVYLICSLMYIKL